jgi:hypothetical protein
MEAFETTLTGSDGMIDGIVSPVKNASFKKVYEFISLDDSLHLTIALDTDGKWIRVAGTQPYFPGWVDELAENVLAPKQKTDTKNE